MHFRTWRRRRLPRKPRPWKKGGGVSERLGVVCIDILQLLPAVVLAAGSSVRQWRPCDTCWRTHRIHLLVALLMRTWQPCSSTSEPPSQHPLLQVQGWRIRRRSGCAGGYMATGKRPGWMQKRWRLLRTAPAATRATTAAAAAAAAAGACMVARAMTMVAAGQGWLIWAEGRWIQMAPTLVSIPPWQWLTLCWLKYLLRDPSS
mmetsp:Transcript_13208/g.40030  ORF Transcript_13208/g.40030 Transcript_13208/m.40030 type:complete len:203 (+) Transcript_13208:457-1065(+)